MIQLIIISSSSSISIIIIILQNTESVGRNVNNHLWDTRYT